MPGEAAVRWIKRRGDGGEECEFFFPLPLVLLHSSQSLHLSSSRNRDAVSDTAYMGDVGREWTRHPYQSPHRRWVMTWRCRSWAASPAGSSWAPRPPPRPARWCSRPGRHPSCAGKTAIRVHWRLVPNPRAIPSPQFLNRLPRPVPLGIHSMGCV